MTLSGYAQVTRLLVLTEHELAVGCDHVGPVGRIDRGGQGWRSGASLGRHAVPEQVERLQISE
jgi:hypothetical protein